MHNEIEEKERKDGGDGGDDDGGGGDGNCDGGGGGVDHPGTEDVAQLRFTPMLENNLGVIKSSIGCS